MLVLRSAVALSAVAAALVTASPAAAATGHCSGGTTIAETGKVRVAKHGGGMVRACWKPTGRRERLGTDAPDNRIVGVRIDGSRVRSVLRYQQPDGEYDFEQVVDVRTGGIVSARFLPHGTA